MRTLSRLLSTSSAIVGTLALGVPSAFAAVFNGTGISGGLGVAGGVVGVSHGSIFHTVVSVIQAVLSLLAVVAVGTVVIAGIYMIVGLGSDDSKEKAKKIITNTLIGLTVVLFCRVIVGLVTHFLASQV